MQYVNDDMDDLFRRAAENYPLDTKSADWSKIAAELEKKHDAIKKPDSNNRKYLWLLLLLPFSFLCNHIFNADVPELGKLNQNEPGTHIKPSIQTRETKANASSVQWNKAGASQQNLVDLDKQNQSNSIDHARKVLKESRSANVDRVNKSIVGINANSVLLNGRGDEMMQERSIHSIDYYKKPFETFELHNKYPSLNIISHPGYHDAIVKESQNLIDPVTNKTQRIYAAIMGGIDATSIKFQKVSNAGYAIGLLLGINSMIDGV